MSNKGFCRVVSLAVLGLATMLFVSGCGQGKESTVTVAGALDLGGAQALPDKATARISIFEHRAGGGDKRIVAERTLHDLDGKSIKFTVDIERNLIDPDGDYGLRGEILSADGTILWHSEKPRNIKPLENDSDIALKLVPNATDADLSFQQFRCGDGFHFAAAIQPERAVVRLGNRRLGMPVTEHSDTFQGEHGNQLIRNANEISVRIDDSAHPNCSVVAEQSPPAAGETRSVSQPEPSSAPRREGENAANKAQPTEQATND
ncbi:hypothetical protein [Salinisphaera sp.]|uniref:hypothetical protein n=1 Tax=Salinisphaera sp. TaxID=1914330 RepID=UPI0025F28607|nr:hypothetical protein [Salinisphaera sp.]